MVRTQHACYRLEDDAGHLRCKGSPPDELIQLLLRGTQPLRRGQGSLHLLHLNEYVRWDHHGMSWGNGAMPLLSYLVLDPA